MVDALVSGTEEGRCKAAKAPGRCQATYDPAVSEWGNPALRKLGKPALRAGGEPGELKHLSTQRKRNQRDSVSSGERKRISPNPVPSHDLRVMRREIPIINDQLSMNFQAPIFKKIFEN